MPYLFTSESVSEGHPDKICDQISDAILDDLLSQDSASRVAVETLVTTGLVHVAGEVTTEGYSEIPDIVRAKLLEIGYNSSEIGFDGNSCGVSVSIGKQSADIAMGVDAKKKGGNLGEHVDEALFVNGWVGCQHGRNAARPKTKRAFTVVDDDYWRTSIAQRASGRESVCKAHVEHDAERLVGALREYAAKSLGRCCVEHGLKGTWW